MRRRLFCGENLFFRLMGRLGDFMCLNLLFLLTSLPVFTAGASAGAMYAVLYDISREREGSCFRRYMKAFRAHFCRATAYWLLCLLAAAFLAMGILGVRYMDGGGRIFFQAASVILAFLWMGTLSFGIILISWADFSVREAFRSAVLMTAGSFPWLFLNLLITVVPVLLIVTGNRFIAAFVMPLSVLFGIPFFGYVKTWVYRQALRKYGLMREEECDKEETAESVKRQWLRSGRKKRAKG